MGLFDCVFFKEFCKSFAGKPDGDRRIDDPDSDARADNGDIAVPADAPAGAPTGSPAQIQPRVYSPLVLAYVGDAVYELYVRSMLAHNAKSSVHKLHMEATDHVRCDSQADVIHGIYDELSEPERNVVRRGRNAHSGYVPKNADVSDYRYATGFEALLGYLFMRGEFDRLNYILELAAYKVSARNTARGAGADAEVDAKVVNAE